MNRRDRAIIEAYAPTLAEGSRPAPASSIQRFLTVLWAGTLAGAVICSAFSMLGYVILAGLSILILTRKEFNR